MNDADLRHILQTADRAASPARSSIVRPEQVYDRRHHRESANRRRMAAAAMLLLLASGVAATISVQRQDPRVGPTPASPAPVAGGASVAPTQLADLVDSQLDAQLAECERRISAFERGARMARVQASRAAIRDPIADLNERRAETLLASADSLRRVPDSDVARQRLLGLVVRLYPQTISAAVARQELGNDRPENPT